MKFHRVCGGQENVFMKKQKKLLTIEWARDSINELRVKQQRQQYLDK